MPMFDTLRNMPPAAFETDDRSGAVLWIAIFFLLAVGFALGAFLT